MADSKLTKAEVKHTAMLANLKLSEEEISSYRRQLSETLTYIHRLNKLNTEKIKPTSQVTGLENVFRQDRKTASLTQKEALANAKEKRKGFFKIRAVF